MILACLTPFTVIRKGLSTELVLEGRYMMPLPARKTVLRAVVYDVRALVEAKDEGFQDMLTLMREALRPDQDELSVAA